MDTHKYEGVVENKSAPTVLSCQHSSLALDTSVQINPHTHKNLLDR